MKRTLWIAGVMCGTLAAFSQTTAAPAFDVASIRPSSEQAGSYMRFLPGGRLVPRQIAIWAQNGSDV